MPQRLGTAPVLLVAVCGLLLAGDATRLVATQTSTAGSGATGASRTAQASRGTEAERWPTDGWRTGTPESQGVDSMALAEAMELVVQKELPLHGLLIVRRGVLVFEAYVYPYQPDVLHDAASVTKSVTSILTGIAIDKGFLPSVTAPVVPLLKLANPPAPEPRRDAMTIASLLTMTSGLHCGALNNEQTGEPELFAMRQAPDWIDFAARLPMRVDPGSRFAYCSVNNHLLSAMITAQTGKSMLDFAREHLFRPLGIQQASWPADPRGRNHGWGDLDLYPRDMAKLGYLYLRRGRWDGAQVVSERYVSDSFVAHASVRPGQGYGYSWWINVGRQPHIPEAIGRGGQRISVIPDKDTVLVFISGGLDTDLLAPYILRALESDVPLPENPKAAARLRQAMKQATNAPRPLPIAPLPATAANVSGRVYRFAPNVIDLQSVTVNFPSTGDASFEIRLGREVWRGPVGFDGVYRFSNAGQPGPRIGGRGRWHSPSVFELDVNLVADISRLILTLRFDGSGAGAQIDVREATGSFAPLTLSATSDR